MGHGFDPAVDTLARADASDAVRRGLAIPLFQPIENLQTGVCRGFEALARIDHGGRLLTPDRFLPGLDADDRLCLFGAMLGGGIALLKNQAPGRPELTVSINVEISLLVADEFVDVLRYFLDRYDFSGERLVLEILENEDVTDLKKLRANIEAIQALGLSVALDDIGSAYASLAKIKDLPIDILKLDRSFSMGLDKRPEDLMFVLSILSLARGLGKRMIVEGIETAEIYDALRVMGVESGQGYAIGRPMPAAEVGAWLDSRRPRKPTRVPTCLLGAYAAHLTVVESCRVLQVQPLPVAWTEAGDDFDNCVVGRLFTARGWHDTEFGAAHRAFHEVLPRYESEPLRWKQAAEAFHRTMADAIRADPAVMGCVPIAVPKRRRNLKGCGCETPPVVAIGGRRPRIAAAR